MLCAWLWSYVSRSLQTKTGRVIDLINPAMHKAWPELLKRMKAGKASTSSKDRQLVVASRTWFCLYLFEHQYVYSEFSLDEN